MSVPFTDEQQVLEALRNVPPERWEDAIAYLRSLKSVQEANAEAQPIRTAADLAKSAVVGQWRDRDDLSDTAAFARRMREQAERREGLLHAAGQ